MLTLEKALLDLLPELAPDAGHGEWQDLNQRTLCQALQERSGLQCIPDQLLTVLRSLARPFGAGEWNHRALIAIRRVNRETLKLRLQRASWTIICQVADKRRAVAGVLLHVLLAKLDERLRGIDLRVECKMGELGEALRADLMIGPQLKDELTAIDAGLPYLHDNGVLILNRGKSVFRPAMTIEIFPEERRGFSRGDAPGAAPTWRRTNCASACWPATGTSWSTNIKTSTTGNTP